MVDQEGGSVRRVPALGPRAAPVLGAGARTVTRREFRATAIGLRALGVDVDLAPVVDVARGGATTGRSFGSAPMRVGAHAAAALGGLGAGGVAGCLKHFPGLGAVALSTDDGVAIDARSRAAVLADLAAFARPIRAGARCVMVSSVIVPALCVRPAMLCPQTYRRLRAMGFRGAIITDSLDAAALRTYGAPAALAVAVLAAGADAAMTTSAGSSIGAVAAIRQAIADHRLRAGRVAASARRLARLR
jgi:beta-N-acetylhexosaminidase